MSVWVEIWSEWPDLNRRPVTLHVSVWVEIYKPLGGDNSDTSRSTWACELKYDSMTDTFNKVRHAPRERVSWNRLSWLRVLHTVKSRSTWACELKFEEWQLKNPETESRSTWACELKSVWSWYWHCIPPSRSTWACELKSGAVAAWQVISYVTLHVSVWVEMKGLIRGKTQKKSRSTWACELKFCTAYIIAAPTSSRSTWACELKLISLQIQTAVKRHAPRERVSWNIFIIFS